MRRVERNFLQLVGRERARIAAKVSLDLFANAFAWWNLRNEQSFRRIAKMRDQFGFSASAEARSIVRLVESAPEFGDELGWPPCERANLRAGLTVTDRPRPIGNMYRHCIRGILALRAIARLTVHSRAGTIEHDFEAKIAVYNAALRAREACEDALALATQVLDRFEQVAAPDQESRI